MFTNSDVLKLFYLHLEHVLQRDAFSFKFYHPAQCNLGTLCRHSENVKTRCLEGQHNSNILNGVTCSNHINLRGCEAIKHLVEANTEKENTTELFILTHELRLPLGV